METDRRRADRYRSRRGPQIRNLPAKYANGRETYISLFNHFVNFAYFAGSKNKYE